jgi:hypothetical protein
MIVLYVNVVEVHLLAEVFLLKDWIFFVLIVVNESNTINQKPVVDNVVFLVIITKQTRAKKSVFFLFFIQHASCDENQNKTERSFSSSSSFFE